MTKQQLIKKYFNQKEKLTLKNPKYKKQVKWFVDFMLNEDLDTKGDITTDELIKGNPKTTAIITAKENGIVAGLEEARWLITSYKLQVTSYKKDGSKVKRGNKIIKLEGNTKTILKLERTILNIIQRMSGIATQTDKLATKSGPLLCPTRKTQWGLLDKKAVVLGGGGTHRLGLYDWILVKDNHLKITNYQLPITKKFYEVECKTEDQVWNLLGLKPGAIMLDNIKPNNIKKLTPKIRKINPNIILEASGGITEKTIREYQKTGVDIISLGSLTHSTKALDLSLNIL
jgi:nicotinate-nucleotide pyrophosphorylase (carboxylating)